MPLFDRFVCSGACPQSARRIRSFSPQTTQILCKLGKNTCWILTGAQHEKDGNEGLDVVNGNRDQWRIYGDGCFFAPKNAKNREKVIAATQQSVDEVYHAYDPSFQTNINVDQLIPYARASIFHQSI